MSVGYALYVISDGENCNVSKINEWSFMFLKSEELNRVKNLEEDKKIWNDCLRDNDFISLNNFFENDGYKERGLFVIFSNIKKGEVLKTDFDKLKNNYIQIQTNERLYKDEVNTLDDLLEKKCELERLIKHQEENVKNRAELLLKSKQINVLPN